MATTRILFVLLMLLALAVTALAWTYKSTYPVPCSDVWRAVKDTLGNAESYEVLSSDDTKMTAAYHVKHQVHANISGAILQRTNKVTLVPKGKGCEMQVVSNYSGWEHDDKGDFKKRVDDALAKAPSAAPPASTTPATAPPATTPEPTRPATPSN